MEKLQFAELLGRFSNSSENEALNVMALKEYFPYCQVFHALSARATRDHRFSEQKVALQLAAVYAADRAVLKQVLSDESLVVGRTFPPFLHFTPSEVTVSERFRSEVETDSVAHDVLEHPGQSVEEPASPAAELDLTRARQTDAGTLNFQHKAQQIQAEAAAAEAQQAQVNAAEVDVASINSPADNSGAGKTELNLQPEPEVVIQAGSALVQPSVAAVSDPAATAVEPELPTAVLADAVELNVADQVISDLERLNQLKNNFEALFEANKASILLRDAAKTVGSTPAEDLGLIQQARQKRIAELVSSLDPELNGSTTEVGELDYSTKNILEEIKNSKQELEPESQRQKDQLQMIDDFIKTQPNLTGKDKAMNAPEDLSSIKTGEFSDNIVSETLVDILIKQGKKDKAVEVLKKLIWKFPQKKAYFAAQIEDLKK